MHQEFWLERWQNNEIGFHNNDFNPHLLRYWPQLALPSGSPVLVPLCGKSKDMIWLRQQSHQVLGVELSPLAISAFFTENEMSPTIAQHDQFCISQSDQITLYSGDFFNLRHDDLVSIRAMYDRAALVALPEEMRGLYARHLRQILQAGVKILLVTFDYVQPEMQGPPFSVPPHEVEVLFADWCDIERLSSEDILEQEPRFKERGLSRLFEHVFALTAR